MNLKRKIISGLLCLFLISGIVTTEFNPILCDLAVSVSAANQIKISQKSKTVCVGQTFYLEVLGTEKAVKWSSSKASVACVSSKGKVTAKKQGSAVITATVGSKKYTCKVNVEKPTLERTCYVIEKGYSKILSIYNTDQSKVWSSTDKKVATVNSDGKVTAVNKGVCNIKCKLSGGKTFSFRIRVKNDITFNQNGITGEVHFGSNNTIIITAKNNNKKSVSAVISLKFYDKNGKKVHSENVDIEVIESGKTYHTFIFEPTKDFFDQISYDDIKFSVKTGKINCKLTNTKAITFSVVNKSSENSIVVTLKNNSLITIETVEICVVFYDKNGKFINYTNDYVENMKGKSSKKLEFSYPYDIDLGEVIKPYSYEVFVNRAMNYN